MSAAASIVSAVAPVPLPDMPLGPAQIMAGNPVARGKVLTQTPDKLVSSGYWSCDVGEFEWTYTWDEFVHLLEGEAVVTQRPGGVSRTLTAGQTAFIPHGVVTHWRIVKPVRKFFVVRTREPLA